MGFESEVPEDGVDEGAVTESAINKLDFSVIWAAPIIPGKAEAWRRFMQEIMGNRQQDYEDACHRLGISAMRGWIAETARGDIGLIAVIASQPERVIVNLSESDLPFDCWFRTQLATLQGLDITKSPRMPPSDLVLKWCGPKSQPRRWR